MFGSVELNASSEKVQPALDHRLDISIRSQPCYIIKSDTSVGKHDTSNWSSSVRKLPKCLPSIITVFPQFIESHGKTSGNFSSTWKQLYSSEWDLAAVSCTAGGREPFYVGKNCNGCAELN